MPELPIRPSVPSLRHEAKELLVATARQPGLENRVAVTGAQRDEFRRRGLLKLPRLLPEQIVAPVRELIRDVLESAGVSREGIWTAERSNGLAYHATHSRLMRKLKDLAKQNPAVSALCTPQLHDVAEQLMDGRTLVTLMNRPQILFTPPNAENWELPHKIWHMDVPRLGEIGCPGVQTFAFIEPVRTGGGGTVVASGSHHCVNDQGLVRSKAVKKKLQAHPWFKGLLHPDDGNRRRYLDAPTRDGDVELQAVELTGDPGDVYLMDLRLLHSLSPNTTDRPRLMATQRYFLADLGPELFREE